MTRWAVIAATGVAAVAFLAGAVEGSTGPVRSRIAVLVDSSGPMLLTPEVVTFPETCVAQNFNGCSATGNPTVAMENCNACTAWTVATSSGCATNWATTCRTIYGNCYRALTGSGGTSCAQLLNLQGGIDTRGDGSSELPGCDLNGDSLANDSRLYQAKQALAAVVAPRPGTEFSLWRYSQIEGGQTCASSAECPDTPMGASVLSCENLGAAGNRCVLDADILDSATGAGFEGQCARLTFTGSPSAFTCGTCDLASGDRAVCLGWALDRVRTGAAGLLASTVSCYPLADPQHRFAATHGAFNNAGSCDPTGGERLVDFPATGLDDNRPQVSSWIDHAQPSLATDVEIRAHGMRPLAASLRDMRTSLLSTLSADPETPCRRYHAVMIAAGTEGCETVAAAQAAAAALQDLSFTNPSGVPISGFSVPVHVIGFGICPSGNPGCPAALDLNAIAAAGGTGAATFVGTSAALQSVLNQIADASTPSELCNGSDDDCDALVDEGYPLGQSCQAGTGVCRDTAQLICSQDQTGVECVPGPPSTEVCNALDDDCNGVTDDGIPAPAGASQMSVDPDAGGARLAWTALPAATSYDIVAGSLGSLNATGGDFTSATTTCLADDTVATGLVDASIPAPGGGIWYLVRGINCRTPGTYDSGAASQQGSSDAEIAASPNRCP